QRRQGGTPTPARVPRTPNRADMPKTARLPRATGLSCAGWFTPTPFRADAAKPAAIMAGALTALRSVLPRHPAGSAHPHRGARRPGAPGPPGPAGRGPPPPPPARAGRTLRGPRPPPTGPPRPPGPAPPPPAPPPRATPPGPPGGGGAAAPNFPRTAPASSPPP